MKPINLLYRFWKVFYFLENLGCWFNIQIENDRKKITVGLWNAQEVDELT